MAEGVLQAEVRRLEIAEQKQEKKARLKKAYAERARVKQDAKRLERAQAEEEQAIAVLRKIKADKTHAETGLKILRYVERNQPADLTAVAKALDIPPETVEEHIEGLDLTKDNDGNIFADDDRMVTIQLTRRLEAWEQERKDVVKRWIAIAEQHPGLTREELKGVYMRQYPDDDGIKRYLKERELAIETGGTGESRAGGTWIIIASLLMLVFLVLLIAVSLHDPDAVDAAWAKLRLTLFGP